MSPVRPDVRVVGRRLDPEHHRLRDFLTRGAQPYTWLDAGTPEAEALLARHGAAGAELPVMLDGDLVVAPATIDRVAKLWKIGAPPLRTSYDLAIVGAGPAGLAAAVYAASDGLATVLIEEDLPGGQASHTSMIENFFGFPDGIGGAELCRLAARQAERFGTEIVMLRGVTGGGRRGPDGPFAFELRGGHEVEARIALVCPGMVWRRLDVAGIEDMLGRGVYYGAGRSEAARCGGMPVVVGAGNSAGQAVMSLANGGAHVTMVVRGDRLGKTMSAYLVDRIGAHPLIDVRLHTRVEGVEADGGELAAVRLTDAGGRTERSPAKALFLCLGGLPRTGWAADEGVRVDPAGFILTGPDLLEGGDRPADWPLARDPLVLETSIPGLFAAGDVRHGSIKRVGGAVGEGAMAIGLAHRRLEELFRTG